MYASQIDVCFPKATPKMAKIRILMSFVPITEKLFRGPLFAEPQSAVSKVSATHVAVGGGGGVNSEQLQAFAGNRHVVIAFCALLSVHKQGQRRFKFI